jgi:hypothetical protein
MAAGGGGMGRRRRGGRKPTQHGGRRQRAGHTASGDSGTPAQASAGTTRWTNGGGLEGGGGVEGSSGSSSAKLKMVQSEEAEATARCAGERLGL